MTSDNVISIVSCFLSGTLIKTIKGATPIDKLSEGDLVLSLNGEFVPIKWIGRQQIYSYFADKKYSPVCIHAGALGDSMPKRDLYISPACAVKVGDFLVAARLLINGVSITQHQWTGHIEYYHIDLGEHHCVLTEGVWSESYAECGDRNNFSNADDFYTKYPHHQVVSLTESCIKRVSDYQDPRYSELFNSLLAQIPTNRVTNDPDLHLLADGIRINPYKFLPNSFMFKIPSGIQVLRLLSRTTSPFELGLSSDNRQLGFCIHSVTAQSEDGSIKITMESHHPKLNEGFYLAEENVRRWTRGNAILPNALLDEGRQNMELTIKGIGLVRYHLSHDIKCEVTAETLTRVKTTSNQME